MHIASEALNHEHSSSVYVHTKHMQEQHSTAVSKPDAIGVRLKTQNGALDEELTQLSLHSAGINCYWLILP